MMFSLLTFLLLASAPPSVEAEFSRLQTILEDYGFQVKIEPTPIRGAYGQLNVDTRTIWIHPIVFELGIARPTLIHEAVHAAQLCRGKKKVQALGLTIPPPPMTRRFFLQYEGYTREIEAEAYTIQVQPDGMELVISLLHQHCAP